MRLRLFHQFVHAHFHECVLWEARRRFRVLCNGRRVNVRKLGASGERLHLLHRTFFRQIRRRNLPIS